MAPPVLYAPYGGYPVTQVALAKPPSPVPAPTAYASIQVGSSQLFMSAN